MIETSGHLPECAAGVTGSGLDCICDRLRACEQRVRDKAKPHSLCGACWRGSHSCELPGRCTCRDCNFAAGVQAARDAVAGLASRLSMTKREGGYDCCGCSSPDDLHDDALAAIDALRGDA